MKSTSMAAISQSKISQNHIYQMAFGRKTNIRSFFGYRCTVFPSRSVLLVLSRRSALSPPVLWLVPPFPPYSNGGKKRNNHLTLFSLNRAPPTSVSTPSSTRRSGKPVSRASPTVSVSASPASVTTRRAPRRSSTPTSRLSTSRMSRVFTPPLSMRSKLLFLLDR